MEIQTIRVGKVVIVAMSGEVDTSSVGNLNAIFDDLVTGGEQNYVIDLAQVTFMDSSGLAALARLYKRIRIGNGDVRLCSLRSDMQRIIELTRFDRVFDIFDSREAAVASFTK